ncbi:DUF4058 family protein [Fimbriiglobus ruber]|uniref:DUF4058 domain-containing protein n=1 Tax=Fimbriiglobus ruber TaxID=1908690 RepID=A0A225E484_9BACT|nr:DUF4058 family protein [Fimbriiglobus ruber]OWK43495.1 hypothetical protein FRUB_03094 [Fimbriiglobus ruber]
MPLRDHFRPPVSRQVSWEEIHGGWPMVIVQQLKTQLPPEYVSGPKVHAGPSLGPTPTAAWTAAEPSLAIETEIPDDDEYEVRVYDADRGRTLVAVIELVSPANKDRQEKRNAFVGKCAALLRKGVSVSIVDVVTVRQFNLYAELMAFLGQSDPTLSAEPPATYAASCRWLLGERRALLETWSHTLTVGQPLPTLPLWLAPARVVPLDLERSYEKTCDDLGVR